MVDQGLSLTMCGLTDSDQACAIAGIGVQAFGVICKFRPGTPATAKKAVR